MHKNGTQGNEQTKQGKSKNKDFRINPHLNHSINMEMNYFSAGLETEADRVHVQNQQDNV